MSGMRSIPLSAAEDLIHRMPVRYAAIAAIGVTTGCRVGEILLLKRFDILDPSGRIRDEIPFAKFKKKGGKEKRKRDTSKSINKLVGDHRFIGIPQNYRKYIARQLNVAAIRGFDRPDDFVFYGKLGKHLSYRTVYAYFRKTLGQGYGTHWMRKTFAQLIFAHYKKLYPSSELTALEHTRKALGHARIDTTIKYLGLDQSLLRDAQTAVFEKG